MSGDPEGGTTSETITTVAGDTGNEVASNDDLSFDRPNHRITIRRETGCLCPPSPGHQNHRGCSTPWYRGRREAADRYRPAARHPIRATWHLPYEGILIRSGLHVARARCTALPRDTKLPRRTARSRDCRTFFHTRIHAGVSNRPHPRLSEEHRSVGPGGHFGE
jgi:hypothetical protein